MPIANCNNDKNCKRCNQKNGICSRCRNEHYLLDGRCLEEASECAKAGLIAVGQGKKDSSYGRACIAAGGVCRFDDDTISCRPPKKLGQCAVSLVVSAEKIICEVCELGSWFIDGICEEIATCLPKREIKNEGSKCSCGDDCRTCNVRQTEAKDAMFIATADGLFAKCTKCQNSKFLTSSGQCTHSTNCPNGTVPYGYKKNGQGGTCTERFSCVDRLRVGGSQEGSKCRCLDKCVECKWGTEGHSCTRCKKKTFLHQGDCVGAKACSKAGGVPLDTGKCDI